jgi:hypothetical protein
MAPGCSWSRETSLYLGGTPDANEETEEGQESETGQGAENLDQIEQPPRLYWGSFEQGARSTAKIITGHP